MLIVLQLKRKGKICRSLKVSDAYDLIHSFNTYLNVFMASHLISGG